MNLYTRTNTYFSAPSAPPLASNPAPGDERDQFRDDLLALLPRMRRFARSLTGSWDLADDLLQACCERALSRQHQWRPGTRLDSWVFTIMRSIRYNELKAFKHTNGKEPLELTAEIADETSPSPEQNILHNEIFGFVNALPELQRVAILAVYVEGYKYRDAAELLGIPLGTLMSRLARAKAQVGQWISAGGSAS